MGGGGVGYKQASVTRGARAGRPDVAMGTRTTPVVVPESTPRVGACDAVPAALVRDRQRAAARRAALREGQVRPIQCHPAGSAFLSLAAGRRRRAWRCRLQGGDGTTYAERRTRGAALHGRTAATTGVVWRVVRLNIFFREN